MYTAYFREMLGLWYYHPKSGNTACGRTEGGTEEEEEEKEGKSLPPFTSLPSEHDHS